MHYDKLERDRKCFLVRYSLDLSHYSSKCIIVLLYNSGFQINVIFLFFSFRNPFCINLPKYSPFEKNSPSWMFYDFTAVINYTFGEKNVFFKVKVKSNLHIRSTTFSHTSVTLNSVGLQQNICLFSHIIKQIYFSSSHSPMIF